MHHLLYSGWSIKCIALHSQYLHPHDSHHYLSHHRWYKFQNTIKQAETWAQKAHPWLCSTLKLFIEVFMTSIFIEVSQKVRSHNSPHRLPSLIQINQALRATTPLTWLYCQLSPCFSFCWIIQQLLIWRTRTLVMEGHAMIQFFESQSSPEQAIVSVRQCTTIK